jgi:hypothetical protein
MPSDVMIPSAWFRLPAWMVMLVAVMPSEGAPRAKPAATNATPEVEFAPAGGFYTNAVAVTLSSTASKAAIYYTTDGREPTTNTLMYQAPIPINRSTYIRARVFPGGLPPSRIAGAAYTPLDESAAAFDSNLPIMVINTFGGYISDDDKRPAYLTVIDTQKGRASLSGRIQFQGRMGVELRGTSSMRFPKHCFGIELDDETTDDDKKAPLLGMPAESDWVLYAPYSDKTLMRDVLAYDLWEAMGHYSVRRRFVEVFRQQHSGPLTSRDYAGIYVLLEKIKQGKHRVNIAKLTPADTNAPAITGGYILKKDRLDEKDNAFSTVWGHALGIEYPKSAKLAPAQARWTREWFDEFETTLMSTNYLHPELGYRKYLDVQTAIDHFWIVEMPKTIDGFTFSVFMHKDRDGKLALGPIWDRNLGFGNVNYQNGDDPHGWYWEEVYGRDLWYRRLFRDPEYVQASVDRWGELRRDLFATSNVLARVDKYAAFLDEAKDREFGRWPRLGVYVWPNADADWPNRTYEGTVQYLKRFIIERLAWLDRQFVPAPAPKDKPGIVPPDFQLAFTNTNAAAAIYFTLNGTDPRQAGGAVQEQAREYKEPLRIKSKTSVFARARDRRGNWSPPWRGVFVVSER